MTPSNGGTAPGGQTVPFPYETTPGGLLWNKETAEGIIQVPLTTFTALITGQVVEDDGAETRRLLEIEATLRQRPYDFKVAAGQFATMNWPMEHLGAGAALWSGFGIKDHARAAIQFLSGDPPERRVYAHLGWRKIGGTWCYLHAGGAIGPVGPVADLLEKAIEEVHEEQLDPRVATVMASLAGALVKVFQAGEMEERLRRLEQQE